MSLGEAKFFMALEASRGRWAPIAELASVAGIDVGTARSYARKLARLQILRSERVHPAYRHQLAESGGDAAYLERVQRALAVFDLLPVAETRRPKAPQARGQPDEAR
jgi:hypothetical protein